jgi:glutathione peroxidase
MLLSALALAACAQAAPSPQAQNATPAPESPDMTAQATDSLFALSFTGLDGRPLDLAAHQGRPVLVVNTASKCGFTPQYKGLQALWEKEGPDGLLVLGVPSDNFGGQEYADNARIAEFCELNFGVTFPLTARADVVGANRHPTFAMAESTLGASAVPKWNFHKVLFNAKGQPVAAFPSSVKPDDPALISAIAAAR